MDRDLRFNIVCIGAGNVGWHLCHALHIKGHKVLQVIARKASNAKALAKQVQATAGTSLNKLNKKGDMYLICVPDDEIEKVASALPHSDKLVIHTSGSVPISVLTKSSGNTGVLYPLQSFSKQIEMNVSKVPFLIEGNSPASAHIIKALAVSLSNKIHLISSEERLKIHLAAVMLNNFSNHLYSLTTDFLKEEKLPGLDLFMPLMEQTLNKIKQDIPQMIQTGPARRGDFRTVQKHFNILKEYPQQKKVYQLFTQLIDEYYHEPKL